MGLDISVCRLVKEPVDNWHELILVDDNLDYCNFNFPGWTKDFERDKVEKYFDWDKYKGLTGLDIDEYEIQEGFHSMTESYYMIYPKGTDEDKIQDALIRINCEDIPLKKVTVRSICYKEVGYQRKGLNSKFYDDYESGRIGYYVWSLSELKRYKDEYCSDDDAKRAFQHNIIDHFEEGKDCVIFSW